MKFGVGISRTVAVFILQRLMNNPEGHRTICSAPKRLQTVLNVLNLKLKELITSYDQTLAKNILLAYESLIVDSQVTDYFRENPMEDLMNLQIPNNCDEQFAHFLMKLQSLQKNHH